MLKGKMAALVAGAAIFAAACSGSGSSSSAGASAAAGSAAAGACHVGVSWPTFQEERYGLRDEPSIKAALEAGGATYTGNDAKLDPVKQAANVESLISAGVNVLVVDAQDQKAILPSVQKAIDAGIPVIAYDRDLDNSKALFMTHDSVEVGHLIADAVTKAQPTGNYAIIKGDKTQTNPLFLSKGFDEVLKPLVDSGAIKVVAEQNTDGWKPENAQNEMEQILTANNNDIQGVLSQNDGMATGAIAALKAQGLDGKVKIGGQDGDKAALNRVALGTQVVSVLKNASDLGKAAGEAALQLCKDPDITKVTGAVPSKSAGGTDITAVLLHPTAITKDNLQEALDIKWITQAELCKDVPAGSVSACP